MFYGSMLVRPYVDCVVNFSTIIPVMRNKHGDEILEKEREVYVFIIGTSDTILIRHSCDFG